MPAERSIRAPRVRAQPVDHFLVRLEQWISREALGRKLATTFGERIPSVGGRVRTGAPGVSPQAKASVFWGLYERRERALIRRYLRRDLDVIEAGGSIGVTGRAILHHVEPGRRLIALEPNSQLIPTLSANIAEASGTADSKVIHGALVPSDRNGELVPFIEGADSVLGHTMSGGTAVATAGVRGYSLATLRRWASGGEFAMVCDIEGAEQDLIDRPRGEFDGCLQLVVELHTTSGGPAEALSLMRLQEEHGFRLFAHVGPVFCLTRA